MKEKTKLVMEEELPQTLQPPPSPPRNNFQLILIALLMVASFVIGTLWTKVQVLEKGGAVAGVGTANNAAAVGNNAPQVPGEEAVGEVRSVSKDDYVRGDRNALIAFIEYSDAECPYCQWFHPTAQQVVDTYKGKVMWVWRHFPLSFHANAQKEAEATECANELGGNDAFWKYLDTIFARTETGGTGFPLDKLVPLAGELGLDQTKFKTCLDSGKYAQHVKDDMTGGSEAGVNGTPGNILLNVKTGDKKLIPGAVPFEQFKQAIDEMLNKS